MNINKVLNSAFKDKIKKAVADAEKKSGGEIVVFISPQSDSYSYSYWAAGFLTLLLGIFTYTFFYHFSGFVNAHWLLFLVLVFSLPLAALFLLYMIKPLQMMFIDIDKINYYVKLKASEAFLHEEVFNTKGRTGVLIYLSLFEKKVVVLGDSGINKKVSKDKWNSVVKLITSGIKKRSLEYGLVSGISACGYILKENNVKRISKDKNELSNSLRIGGKK